MAVWYSIDTEASRTVVSSRVYDNIKEEDRPDLRESCHLNMEQANGTPLHIQGLATLPLSLGDHIIEKQVIVADIKDDVLIGMDIGKEVDVLTSQKKVCIDGQEVSCTHIVNDRVYKVKAADTYRIAL